MLYRLIAGLIREQGPVAAGARQDIEPADALKHAGKQGGVRIDARQAPRNDMTQAGDENAPLPLSVELPFQASESRGRAQLLHGARDGC